jgi:hypothetical protein
VSHDDGTPPRTDRTPLSRRDLAEDGALAQYLWWIVLAALLGFLTAALAAGVTLADATTRPREDGEVAVRSSSTSRSPPPAAPRTEPASSP